MHVVTDTISTRLKR